MVKADNMSKQCDCSGAYETTVAREQFLKKMKTMFNIAAFHKVLEEEIGAGQFNSCYHILQHPHGVMWDRRVVT
jgi:hypothetical protein